MIDVSVIIINYNTFELTRKCIESVLRFTAGISYEVILVDNASTEKDVSEFKMLFPEIVLVKNTKNVGFAAGNNDGIKVARGHTILLLNSDAEIMSNVIGELYQTLHQKADTGVITCKLVFPDGRIQHQCGRFPSIALQLLELFRLQKLMPKRIRAEILLGGFFDHARSVYPDWIWGTFFMFKREVLNCFEGQKLPDTYFMYQEDLEWCYLIQRCRYKIFYDPSHSILHHFSGSSVQEHLIARKRDLLTKNLKDFLIRFYGKTYTAIFFRLHRMNVQLQRKRA
jgi:hypothetical protein